MYVLLHPCLYWTHSIDIIDRALIELVGYFPSHVISNFFASTPDVCGWGIASSGRRSGIKSPCSISRLIVFCLSGLLCRSHTMIWLVCGPDQKKDKIYIYIYFIMVWELKPCEANLIFHSLTNIHILYKWHPKLGACVSSCHRFPSNKFRANVLEPCS